MQGFKFPTELFATLEFSTLAKLTAQGYTWEIRPTGKRPTLSITPLT